MQDRGAEKERTAGAAQAPERDWDEGTIAALSGLFKILGDPTRARIVLALDQRERTGSELTALLGMTKSAISHQMRILKEKKIVKSRRAGKHIFFSLDDQHITDIIELAVAHLRHAPPTPAAEKTPDAQKKS